MILYRLKNNGPEKQVLDPGHVGTIAAIKTRCTSETYMKILDQLLKIK